MRATALILSIAACSGFVFKTPSAVKPLRAETTESEAPAEAEAPAEPAAPAEEPAAAAPAPSSASFNPDKVFKVDESPLMAYISRSWNKLDGSDTVEVEEMLGAASTRLHVSARRRLADAGSRTPRPSPRSTSPTSSERTP